MESSEKLEVRDDTRDVRIKIRTGPDYDGVFRVDQGTTQRLGLGWDDSEEVVSLSYGSMGNNHLNIDSAGNVGIGTTEPNAKLKIEGSGDNLLRIEDTTNDNGLLIGTDDNLLNYIRIRPTGGDGIAITNQGDEIGIFVRGSDGNVGIGVVDPGYNLEIEDTDLSSGEHLLLGVHESTTGGGVYIGYVADGSTVTEARVRAGASRNLALGSTNYPQALYILGSNGNVGIGTPGPEDPLHIYSTGPNRLFIESTDPLGYAGVRAKNPHHEYFYGINTGSDRWVIHDNSVDQTRLMVDSLGNVGIGVPNALSELHIGGTTPQITIGDGGAEDTSLLFNGNAQDFYIALDDSADDLIIGTGTSIGSNTKMVIENNGEVGIGISNPASTLDVLGTLRLRSSSNSKLVEMRGTNAGVIDTMGSNGNINCKVSFLNGNNNNGYIGVYNSDGNIRANMYVRSSGVGKLTTYGPNGNVNFEAWNLDGYPNNGYIDVCDENNIYKAGMFVNPDGDGIVWGDVKNFRVDNPNDPDTEIWYASVEGPEAAVYIRGTGQLVDGRAVITFPDHFLAVAVEEGMTVQVTPLSADSKGLAVTSKSLTGVEIQELGDGRGNYEFDWEVKSVRQGHEDYQVIRSNLEARPEPVSELTSIESP
jgi:hypothetical protein